MEEDDDYDDMFDLPYSLNELISPPGSPKSNAIAEMKLTEEEKRLKEDNTDIRNKSWRRFGPYLSDREWGTVREDYSYDGETWDSFTHEQSRSRVYRWGEDGIMGICDRQCRLTVTFSLWNGKDKILKERLFGLTGKEGNHGEDCKELYYYLEATPTNSYLKGLYKYPQNEYPYTQLITVNKSRSRNEPEYEILDTGVFDDDRYWDIGVEYAKNTPNDILIKYTITNKGNKFAVLDFLPTLMYRNTWGWGRNKSEKEGYWAKPNLTKINETTIRGIHEDLGTNYLYLDPSTSCKFEMIFTNNESNLTKLWGVPNKEAFVKDGFHSYVCEGKANAINSENFGTKAAFRINVVLGPHETRVIRLRLCDEGEMPKELFGPAYEIIFSTRLKEAHEFYRHKTPTKNCCEGNLNILKQAYAGLIWSKQYYYYDVSVWLEGDPSQPKPPKSRLSLRNHEWKHLYCRDIISMPDCWEYPWFAAWDTAFHMVPFARIDPVFAKNQLILLLREWYMHPNGQIPAYEFNFSDVNPPVHAWSAWQVYRLSAPRGQRDVKFLKRIFHKLLLNWSWWVNRKDLDGNNLFAGGFLGLDNIGVFDRSKPLPTGGVLEQADGSAWMAFFCVTMLEIALELAKDDPAFEDLASKFFEHFIAIADSMNTFGGRGLWDEEDGFYYDQLKIDDQRIPMKVRSMVGLIPLFACGVLKSDFIHKLPGFYKRMKWYLNNKPEMKEHIHYLNFSSTGRSDTYRLLAIPSKERLKRVLAYVLDEDEFLSLHGIRSLSKVYEKNPYKFEVRNGSTSEEYKVEYVSGDSNSWLFGGNSNWRGPIWLPVNFLLVEALRNYHYFYGSEISIECPTRSGKFMNLAQVAEEISKRLVSLFEADGDGKRACFGQGKEGEKYAKDWPDLIQFHEFFDGDNGRGCGASHQTGWTALITRCVEIISEPAVAGR